MNASRISIFIGVEHGVEPGGSGITVDLVNGNAMVELVPQ